MTENGNLFRRVKKNCRLLSRIIYLCRQALLWLHAASGDPAIDVLIRCIHRQRQISRCVLYDALTSLFILHSPSSRRCVANCNIK